MSSPAAASSSSTVVRSRSYLLGNPSILLLATVVGLFVNAMFIAAMIHCSFDPRVTLFYASSLLLYTALYLYRRLRPHRYRHRYAVLRRGLGYAALGLAAWLLLAVPAAYCLYRVIVLHLDAEEDAMQARVPV